MLRTIEYTVSPDSISPYSPQFAGIQGEDGATVLDFSFDAEFTAAINALSGDYDSVIYRVDCEDGAGRYITGQTQPFDISDVQLPLAIELTETGGRLRGCLIISGVNIDDTQGGTRLFSIPFELYFKDFPIAQAFSPSADLNKVVTEVKQMRDESYDIAASALETKTGIEADIAAAETEIEGDIAQSAANAAAAAGSESNAVTSAASAQGSAELAVSSAAAAQSYEQNATAAATVAEASAALAAASATQADDSADTAVASATSAQGFAAQAESSATSAQGSAALAAASASQADGSADTAGAYATAAQSSAASAESYAGLSASSAEAAETSADNAEAAATEVLAVVGNINSVLATLVNGTA